jgi:hypothetical protein
LKGKEMTERQTKIVDWDHLKKFAVASNCPIVLKDKRGGVIDRIKDLEDFKIRTDHFKRIVKRYVDLYATPNLGSIEQHYYPNETPAPN